MLRKHIFCINKKQINLYVNHLVVKKCFFFLKKKHLYISIMIIDQWIKIFHCKYTRIDLVLSIYVEM